MNITLFVLLVKAGLSHKNAQEVLTQLQHVIAALTGNPNFPTTTPTLAELQQTETELSNAIVAAAYGGSNLIAIRNDLVGKTKQQLTMLSANINIQSEGDLVKALSSGLPPVSPKTPADLLPAPANARGRALGNGRIVLNWGGLKGKRVYIVESTIDPNMQPTWDMRGQTSKNRMVIENLSPGVLYYFRIAGVNNFGNGAFSDVVAIRCI